jgi:hypothetical protein
MQELRGAIESANGPGFGYLDDMCRDGMFDGPSCFTFLELMAESVSSASTAQLILTASGHPGVLAVLDRALFFDSDDGMTLEDVED